ncbi:MAG: hypothetical protein QOE56_575 [Solirubrobacterales bacterium]|jgi:hypothetical protein|nr:hypothetical protein [Solirubrobacterales bacterium]
MTGKKQGKLALVAVAVISAWALLVAAVAQANTVTVGSVLPPGAVSEPVNEVVTFFNTALPEKGASLSSPASGAIVRWQLQGAKGGPFYLRVLRPNGLGAYTAVGTSDPATVTGTGLQTFTTNLPIKAGDLIAVDPTNPTDELGFVTAAGAAFTTIFPTPLEGATRPAREPKSGKEIELSAEVQPTPGVTEISPRFGSVTGGTAVKITGTNFTGASAVKFGSGPAASFKVESDTEIIATAPQSTKIGAVDVTVTTLAGTSATVSKDRFTYTGCVVPKLKGKKLGKAKQLIQSAGCKLGKVTKRHGVTKQTGKVKQQNPQAGKVLAKGTKVRVTLG